MNGYYENYAGYRNHQRNRRVSYLGNRVLCVIMICLTVLLISLFCISKLTFAKEQTTGIIKSKCYKSIQIQCGDSLDQIASDYFDEEYSSVSQFKYEIMCINHINDTDELIAGNYIVIPYYETAVSIEIVKTTV